MEPVSRLEEISQAILKKYNRDTVVTIGILVADWRQDEARQYIINYMNMFDEKSGKYIDFYIPGYFANCDDKEYASTKKYHPNSNVKRGEVSGNLAFYMKRNETPYCFDSFLFEDFIKEMEFRMGIKYTYNPMLILVELNRKKYRGDNGFQDKLVIELDNDTNRGLRRTGQLFDKIFEIAIKNVKLDRFGRDLKMYCIKGKAIENIAKMLEGEWIEAVVNIDKDIRRYKIKSTE